MRPDVRPIAVAEARAVLFDLDDTLYPLDRFVLSGFAAVAAHLRREYRVGRRRALASLVRAFAGARGQELQCTLAEFGLPATMVPVLVGVIRAHRPRLRLPRPSARVLAALRPRWRLGIVTNGLPDIQARKVAALGLDRLVDTVVYAHDGGRPAAKPDPAPFLEAADRLRVPAVRAVFVGDDPACDVFGAAGVGMRTIHLGGGRARASAAQADAIVGSLTEVPHVAEWLVEGNGGVHGV